MPSATPATSGRPRTLEYAAGGVAAPRSVELQFLLALILTVVICVVFWLGYYFEREILNRHPGNIRFIRNATEAAMRYITIPHIVIGFLFMASSRKNRTPVKRMWILGLLAAGTGLCSLYHLGGAKTNVLLMIGVYLYFLVHELRDETMFYHALGNAPSIADRRVFNRMTRIWIGCLVFAAGAFVWIGIPLGLMDRHMEWSFDSIAWALRIAMAVAPLLACGIVIRFVLRHYARRLGHDGVASLVRAHAPMFRVSLGVLGVVGLSLLITERAYSLILFHVAGWYLFAAYQFTRHPPKRPPDGWWAWMRSTAKGFKTLHIAMVAVLIVIGLVWTLGLHQTPYLAWLLAPESFLYWTIMHITISFVPR